VSAAEISTALERAGRAIAKLETKIEHTNGAAR
jgi:hypothetical protein